MTSNDILAILSHVKLQATGYWGEHFLKLVLKVNCCVTGPELLRASSIYT